MNTNGINVLDLETSTLKLVDDPAKRSGGVGTGEDVLVHEETPVQVLVLPSLSETSVLEEEDTIVVKHVVNLGEERREVADTDVLRHLETGNLVVTALGNGDIAVVHAQNVALLLGNANLAHSGVAPSGLVASKSDTGSAGTVVLTGKSSKSSPTTADVEEALALLEVDLLANDGHLVVLELLESLLLGNVGDDTRGVNHTRAQEPTVEVITAVVVVTDLLLICNSLAIDSRSPFNSVVFTLRTSVHNDLGNHAKEEKLDETNGEAEAGPVVSVLHNLETVTLEVDVAVEVLLVESFHGNLLMTLVLVSVGLLLEVEVLLDGTARESNLVVLSGRDGRDDQPPGAEKGEISKEGKEDGSLETTTDLPAEVPGDKDEDGDQAIVVEGIGTRAIGREGSIVNSRELEESVLENSYRSRRCRMPIESS